MFPRSRYFVFMFSEWSLFPFCRYNTHSLHRIVKFWLILFQKPPIWDILYCPIMMKSCNLHRCTATRIEVDFQYWLSIPSGTRSDAEPSRNPFSFKSNHMEEDDHHQFHNSKLLWNWLQFVSESYGQVRHRHTISPYVRFSLCMPLRLGYWQNISNGYYSLSERPLPS